MTAKLQTYSEYPPARRARAGKPSGVDWLGDIPVDWQVFKFKELFRTSDERLKNDPSVDKLLSVSGYRGVEPKDISSMEGQMPSNDVSEYRIVRKGQLAVNTMWLNYAGLGVSEYEGYISPAYRAYHIKSDIDNKFAHYLLRSSLYVQKYTSLLYGVRPNSLQVKPYDFEHIEILLPPLETQKRIADFLDEKTKVIDDLVAKKEKLTELLREKRAALITRVVTKGLDPNAKLKPSGVDWLGDIPAGWEVRKLKYLSTYVKTGSTPDSDQPEYFELGSIPWYTPGDFTDSVLITKATKYINNKAISDGQSKLFKENSILLIGIGATLGKVGFSNTEFSANQQINVIYIKYQYLAKFYAYYLLGIRDVVVSTSNASTLGILNQEKTKQILCVVPSKKEQIEIVNYIDRKWDEFEKIVLKLAEQIARLKEYRSSLIYHAVTGKIKI